jgi:hypothetical protein
MKIKYFLVNIFIYTMDWFNQTSFMTKKLNQMAMKMKRAREDEYGEVLLYMN